MMRLQRNGFSPLAGLHGELGRMFEDFFGPRSSVITPPVDLWETDEGFAARVALPGVVPEEIDIQVEGSRVTLQGRIPALNVPEGATLLAHEHVEGRFERVFELPRPIDRERVEARVEHGVLHLELPEAAESRPRRIEIKQAR